MNVFKKMWCSVTNVLKTQQTKRMMTFFFCFAVMGVVVVMAQGAGQGALNQVATDIKNYIPAVQKVIYAIAGVVALVGAVNIYIKMNNGEQDISKSIMMLVGACLFLVAAAQALPLFFE